MTVVSAYKTDVGRERKHNEDYVWVDEPSGVYIVADGMGGQEAGDVASQLAATTVGQLIATRLRSETEPLSAVAIGELLTQALEVANQTVLTAAKKAAQKRRMGAALVVALVRPPTAYISHVGDTRAYLLRNSVLSQLTKDDSWVTQLVEAGLLSDAEAHGYPGGHILTKAIGQDPPLESTLIKVTIAPGDWLLLCSDGLWNMLEDEQILVEFEKADDDPAHLVEILIEMANAAGGRDNISVMAIKLLPAEM